jgi:ribosomal protein S1
MATTSASPVGDSSLLSLLEYGPPIPIPKPGETVEGKVLLRGKNKLYIDLGGVLTGVISGRELRDSQQTYRRVHPGDTVAAMVLEEENEEGMVVLSLRRASQTQAWKRIRALIENDATMAFTAQEANKGGLLANMDGIRAFLPVSQLAPVHYPRVNNADATEILNRLKKLEGHTFTVKVITVDEDVGKIVVSERDAMSEERARALESLKAGDVREGLVSGIVKFGIFVAFDGLEGLVHISEMAWGHVKNPAEHVKMGDKVTVKVIGIDGEKLSLSMKQLTKDPWEEVAEKYPVGRRVTGTVTRITDYGAFLKIENDINGLVHLSEISHRKIKDPLEALSVGQKVDVQVIALDPDERRIGFSIKALQPIDRETLEMMKKEREEERRGKEKEAKEAREAREAKDVGKFIASKTGKKYYPADSARAKKIKMENRVEFSSEEEARAAGYVG